MIKIIFKQPTEVLQDKLWPVVKFVTAFDFDLLDSGTGDFRLGFDTGISWDFKWWSQIKKIEHHDIESDPMLDREHILMIQGITKEQDEANQKEWSKL